MHNFLGRKAAKVNVRRRRDKRADIHRSCRPCLSTSAVPAGQRCVEMVLVLLVDKGQGKAASSEENSPHTSA